MMIKPYLNYTIHIKNRSTYQDLLKKKPKHTQQFKFSTIQSQREWTLAEEKRIQLQLLKLVKIVKPVTKLDLRDCVITDYESWQAKLLAICKGISHIRTLFVMSSESSPKVKYFKNLPKLKNLLCKLDDAYLPEDYSNLNERGVHKYLKYLKYCPKIRSLSFGDLRSDSNSPKIVIAPNRYMRSLESLALNNEREIADLFEFPIESCNNLRSISLKAPNLASWEAFPRVLKALFKLPNLQEINVISIGSLAFDFLEALNKVTKKGTLKKVRLKFHHQMPSLGKLLESLMTCKLRSFSFKTLIQGGLLKSVSQFLKSMASSLESLELHLLTDDLFSKEDDDFIELCKQISKLRMLRGLKLHFTALKKVPKDTRLPNFLPYLANLFTKPIKIESLRIKCKQLDPSEALQSLVSILESSANFLTHLKINFGALPCTDKTFRLILKLMQSLSSIQVLKIPCLAVSGSTSHFLNVITKTIYQFKYIRVFVIGEIKNKVPPSEFYDAVEAIRAKRGLRRFDYLLSHCFFENAKKEADMCKPNVKKMITKNPYFEAVGDIYDPPDNEE